MRLALICTELTTVPPIKGGAVQTHIAGILPYLSRVHETTVICTEDKDLPVNEVREGVRYLRLPAPSAEGYLEHVCAAVASERFDLIHVFNRPAWLLRIGEAAPRSRIALRVHNDMFTPSKIGPDAAAAAIRRAGAIDTVSDFLTRRIADQYPQARAKLRTLYTGVDLERFWPHWTAEGEALRRQGRHDMGLGTDPVILFVGRLSSTKGPDILLQAMPFVLQAFPQAVLLIVGSRWFGATERTDYSKYLETLADPLGDRVRFTGYVPALEIERVFAVADLFVCPSQWEEPLARVQIEAMAAGLPIVTTPRGGNLEAVFEDVNGMIVHEYQEPEAFARLITGLLADPERRRRLGENGRRIAEGRFHWRRVAGEVLEMYDRIVYLGGINPLSKGRRL